MDGWTDEQMDGWMDGWMYGWKQGMNECGAKVVVVIQNGLPILF
jgi:hypothetical protein